MSRRLFMSILALLFWPLRSAKSDEPKKLYPHLKWGTYGKGGCNWPHVKWVNIDDCSDEHLRAILETQGQIKGTQYESAIQHILRYRKRNGIVVEDTP